MNKLNFVKNFKAYTLRIKDRKKQNLALLRSYLKKQRGVIIQKTQKKMIRGVLWIGLLSVSYYFAHRIYSQKLQVQQMQNKLTRLYPSIVTKIATQENDQVYYVVPEYDDQLANIIRQCWKYHYKVIINSDQMQPHLRNQHTTKFLKQIPEAVRDKCLIINLQKLKDFQLDEVNGIVKVQSGITCKEFNQRLKKLGYQPIFPQQIAQNQKQTVYNAIVNNYPTNDGPITNSIVNIDLISPQGQYFRSSNQNNQYGSTPNLNAIFVGTGGIFGLPIRTNFKLYSKVGDADQQKVLLIASSDLNQKLIITRKIRQVASTNCKSVQFNIQSALDKNMVLLKLKVGFGPQVVLDTIGQKLYKQIPDLKQTEYVSQALDRDFNIFFNTNQSGFQKFLILRQNRTDDQQKLEYQYSNNLLKVSCKKQPLLIQLTSQLCSENAVVVWCKDHRFLKDIKKTTDESQVGSELMKILVQIRQGIDHKKIYYTHNRYEQYFAKSTFRKLTQVFW